MAAKTQTQFFGHGHDLGQEIDQMGAQAVFADPGVFGDVLADIVQREAFGGTGQSKDHVPGQRVALRIAHRREPRGGSVAQGVVKIFCGAGAGENMQVEGGEIGQIEPHAGGAVGPPPRQIGTGPVEHRHEVVADYPDPCRGQVSQAGRVGVDMRAPVAPLLLYVLGNRQAFHHVPGQPGWGAIAHCGDLALALSDFLGGPDRAGRHVMQGRNDAFDPRLQNIVDGHQILGPEPPPSLLHVSSSRVVVVTLASAWIAD